MVCYCKAGINYPSFLLWNPRISLCFYFLRESPKPCTFLKMRTESWLSSTHFQEGIGREPATETEWSEGEVRSTAEGRKREPATETEWSEDEVRSTAAVCIRRNKEYLIKKEENR